MLKFSRLPMGLLALTIAGPVMAQPATTTTPSITSPSSTMAPAVPATPKASTSDTRSTVAAPKTDTVDINSATAAELKMLPGVSDSDGPDRCTEAHYLLGRTSFVVLAHQQLRSHPE